MQDVLKSEATVVQPRPPAPELHPVPAPNGDGELFAVEQTYKLEHRPGPRIRRRTHTFHDLVSFAAYLNRHAKDREHCEILLDEESVTAALDPGNVTGDVVTCRLEVDPRFAAWNSAWRRKLDQRQLYGLIRAQREDMDEQTAGLLLVALQTLHVVRDGEIRSELDERGFTRFAAQTAKQQLQGTLPPGFSIRVPVFEGVAFSEGADAFYGIEVLLYPELEAKQVTFTLEAPGIDAVVRRARRDARDFLQDLLEEPLMVGLGEFASEEVPAYSGRPLHENAKQASPIE